MTDAEQVLRRAAEMLGELDAEAGAGDPSRVHAALAEVALRWVDGAGSASVTTWDGRRLTMAASTDKAAAAGTTVAAGKTGTTAAAGTAAATDEPAATDEVARQADELQDDPGTLSLRVTEAATLNLYAREHDPFASEAIQMATLLATHARTTLLAADNAVRADNLERSRQTTQHIGAAVGLLMAIKSIGHDEARDLLRTISQRTNRRVSDLATEVLDTRSLPSLTRRRPPKERQPRETQPKRPEM